MTEIQKAKLDFLQGKKRIYNGRMFKFMSWKLIGETVSIIAEPNSLSFSLPTIDSFLDEVVLAEEAHTIMNNSIPNENVEIKQTLLDVLKSLKNNPSESDYKKAAAINETINTMVNVQKVEFQMYRMMERSRVKAIGNSNS